MKESHALDERPLTIRDVYMRLKFRRNVQKCDINNFGESDSSFISYMRLAGCNIYAISSQY